MHALFTRPQPFVYKQKHLQAHAISLPLVLLR